METIIQSLILMATGMGAVFSFLVILIVVMTLMAKVTPKLSFMLPDPEPPAPKKPAAAADDEAVAVAIAVAMKRAGK
jgi:sodium pump decarboxylase gamma subunit